MLIYRRHNGRVFNRNEGGNIVWGAVMSYLGYSEFESTTFAHLASIIENFRPDEEYDQRAISHGHRYHLYNLSSKWGYREGSK